MKLLQVNPVVRTNTSTGRIVREIAALARERGWQTYVAYSRGRDGLCTLPAEALPVGSRRSVVWHGLQTRLLDRHGLASTAATRRFVQQLEHLRPDVIHLHNIHGYFLDYRVLFRYLASSGVPVVWTVHDCWLYTGHCYYYSYARCTRWQQGCHHCPQRRQFPASWLADRSARNFADKRAAFTSMPRERFVVVPVSRWMKGEMERSFLAGYDLRVIHNGIDTDAFRPCAAPELLARYGLEGKHILLGVASIWSREKGLDDFVRMASMLAPDEVIVLVGVKEKLRRRLPAGIVGIERTANVQQLAALYAAADAFVNPTWQDNYPTVNLEALSCGTPVVTYRTGGSVEAVTPATGLVVEQGDVAGLLAAVRSLRQADRDALRQACRQYALAHFQKAERYADYFRLYDELLAARAQR